MHIVSSDNLDSVCIDIGNFVDCNIPLPPSKIDGNWTSLPIKEKGSRLVAVGMCPDKDKYRYIFSIASYAGGQGSPYERDEVPGALFSCFMREEAADGLAGASEDLRKIGCVIVASDAYRPLSVQDFLFNQYVDGFIAGGYSREVAENAALVHIRAPGDNAPHTYGSTVDLTIAWLSPEVWKKLDKIDQKLQEINGDLSKEDEILALEFCRQEIVRTESVPLDTGHKYDRVTHDEHGHDMVNAYYYERKRERQGWLSPADTIKLINRRFIAFVLMKAGFALYPDEQGQFNLFDKPWAQATGAAQALFGPVKMSDANIKHEKRLRDFDKKFHIFDKQPPGMKKLLWRIAKRADFQKPHVPDTRDDINSGVSAFFSCMFG